ncbi:DUF1853 family protein [Hyunsoonleella pacifica]|uniref:DUF1853 family protein n=1 Tax=Hyunsoonleella pacifica TaxID=1080224 RepID=UPI001E5CF0AE|nr:DUF1853 family protein [Hyunsoonleella pacifica]
MQKRYEGFLNTSYLWHNNAVFDLKQFEISSKTNKINIAIDEQLRLGKYVERLVSFELEQQAGISIIAENIQIQKDKTTLGELDCLLLRDNTPIHLEVIYKFYLFDDSAGNSEIEHFIGPNRKDSLIEKLNKLKDKQLPLLFSDVCKPYLEELGLQTSSITQYVYFKAQLFLPFSNQNRTLNTLNTSCISGYYLNKKQLLQLIDCKFHIPNKKDWLVIPYTDIDWLNFDDFIFNTKDYLAKEVSILSWVKFKNGEIKKMFLVWW